MVKVMAVLVALLALLGEREAKRLPGVVRRVVAESLGVPERAVSVEVGMGQRAISKVAVRTEGGKVPVELLRGLRPTGRRPSLPVEVERFSWEGRGVRWGGLRVERLSVRLRGAELDGTALLKGRLKVGRVGSGELEVLLSPADLVRALAEAGAPVSRVEFSRGTIGLWLGPRGLGTLFVRVRPRVSGGKIGFAVVEARAGFVPIPKEVAQAAVDGAVSRFWGSLSVLGGLSGLEVSVGPEGLLIRGRLGPRGGGLERRGGVVLQ